MDTIVPSKFRNRTEPLTLKEVAEYARLVREQENRDRRAAGWPELRD